MLVPAGVLVLVVLAAIAVDSAIAFMAQREMINRASAAASDAATVAITDAGLQQGFDARPDASEVRRVVNERLVGQTVAGYTVAASDVATSVSDDVVTVEVTGEVPYIFAPAVPGADRYADIAAVGSAQLRFAE
jgi:Flp pilus assembly protein TadG